MPRNGSGQYQAPSSSWNPATSGVNATPGDWNNLLADISTAISGSVAADGQTPMSGPLRMGGNQITNVGAPTANGNPLRWQQLQKGADIASAATISIPNEGALFAVTGTTTITGIDSVFPGRTVFLQFADAVTIQNGISLILPNASNYTTAAGEILQFINTAPGVWQMMSQGSTYQVGDFLDTLRTLDATWLKRDGALYTRTDYPDLAALSPVLPDGAIWTTPNNGVGVANATVEYLNGSFIAMAKSGTDTIVTKSTDNGRTWNVVATIPTFLANAVCFGSGSYLAVGNGGRISTSFDGETWTASVVVAGIDAKNIVGCAFGAGNFFFATRGTPGTDTCRIMKSNDLATWTQVYSTTVDSFDWLRFLNNNFLAGMGNPTTGKLLIAGSAGTSWSTSNYGSPLALWDAGFAAGTYVVVGDSGMIKTSTDLVNWTTRTSGTTNSLRGVTGSSAGFLVVGYGGVARLSSTAGAVWGSTITGVTQNLMHVAENNGTYVAVGPVTNNLVGVRTLSTQFRVPDDSPTYGWIKAK